MANVSAKYIHQRLGNCLRHSIPSITTIARAVVARCQAFSTKGIDTILLSHIPAKYSTQLPISGERNKIQPITTNTKVSNIRGISLHVWSSSRYLLFLPISSNGTNNNAWYAPHSTNVQFAPCQKPESRKIIKVLRTEIHLVYAVGERREAKGER